jgi:hypothetical protein
MPEARQHHVIPQCYLRGFTTKGKKSQLHVFDVGRCKRFMSSPRNVAGVRDFNRVEMDGVEPDAIEIAFSVPEGRLADALRNFEETPLKRETTSE